MAMHSVQSKCHSPRRLSDLHIPAPELKDRLELATLREEVRGRLQTLSGMMK